MQAYIIRRLLLIIPTLILVTIVVFFLIRLIPGDIIEQMVQQHIFASTVEKDQTVEAIRHKLGLDVPIHVQYGRWVGGIITRGDLGISLWKNTPVTEEIFRRLPVSIELGLIAIAVALAIALPVGIYSAIRQDTGGDYIARSFAILCICVPSFWLGTMVMVFPSIWWDWIPPLEFTPFFENPIQNLQQFIIPAIILGMVTSGTIMRMTRTMMLEVLRQDYVRTAWSKGLRERVVVTRHALKNALIPVITILGFHTPVLIGGSVIIEQIFCLPGTGRLFIDAMAARDYTIVTGINLFVACFVLLNILVIDLTYAYLDPRVRYK